MPENGLELAQIGDILIIARSYESLEPFKKTLTAILVDSINEFRVFL